MTPAEFRRTVRAGRFRASTAGLCGDFAQANLVVLPHAVSSDFLRFCALNPKACPLLAVGEPGQWALPALGAGIDVRSDLPGYYLYRNGELAQELPSLAEVWQDDLVAFAIGCSFSFEQMLLRAGIALRHVAQHKNVAMYRSQIPNKAAGPFGGQLVVSMRPLRAADAIRAIQISSRFPAVHGAPVHFGDPALIGIGDLQRPDYGDAVEVLPDETPVFWACGVTPQEAIRSARLPLAIAHKPGHMLITDIPNERLAVF
ncbi:putative hydro-lyase [Verminephrobacter aporrectodeae]|uniref:putative hydro-lyase n=1 Tax=Verminephrobacter aporrectodeae TaxID=1110389 RepID=UPI0002375405|nr:putative hydro-lyase [Verminephrobacter aporrectodeae]MCW5220869.1 putative hydro-lyase [Verminephrobacter aporrectodeae subsp. tuberculatae]MCW5255168.1 putative hydro-lyase [Verminephrobacter aporrectodeae subsp. tuberculatae]MCW5290164.1 putative hydro-lyase [Verminephrobacter aporrectodeae subsp. tuberculatae]MCW8174502.1 putative hydro-lyase [Verminephrobacter aporrectodeae subsp. tuberculatae]MCW8197850.1 putative hydro-lyase [Verminephrobacter aporrectodeae subsp. tuberculatae]